MIPKGTICGLCGQNADDGVHKEVWYKIREGIKMATIDCPYWTSEELAEAIYKLRKEDEGIRNG